MKINEETKRFLNIYQPIYSRAGIKSDAIFCKKVLRGFNPAQLSQAKKGRRNIPPYILHRFVDYFELKESIIFGEQSGKQKANTIEFENGTTKKIISRVEAEGTTILILK